MMQVNLPDTIANIPTPKLDQGQSLAPQVMNVENIAPNSSFAEAFNQILSNSLTKIDKSNNNEETTLSSPQIFNQNEALENNSLFLAMTQLIKPENAWGVVANNNVAASAVQISAAPLEFSAKDIPPIDVNTNIIPQAIHASKEPLALLDNSLKDNNEPLIAEQVSHEQLSSINKSILPEAITSQPKYYSSNEEENLITAKDKVNEKISSKVDQVEQVEHIDQSEKNPQELKQLHAQDSVKNNEVFNKEHHAYRQTNNMVNDYYQENLQAVVTNKTPGKIEVQLYPQELGHIEIVFDFNARNKEISITAEKLETLEMLQKDARNLEKVLNDVGLRADNSTLSFSLSHGNNRGFFAHEKLPYENNFNTASVNEVTTAVMRSVAHRQLDLVI